MKTELDRAVGVLPPSTIDLDALIRRRRKAARWRRIGLNGAVAVAVLAVVVVTGSVVGGWRSSAPAVPATSTSPRAPETRAQTAARLTAALRAAMRARLPNVAFEQPGPGSASGTPLEFTHIGNAGRDYYRAEVRLTDGPKRGSFTVDIGRVGQMRISSPTSCQPLPRPDMTRCETVTTPRGDIVFTAQLGTGNESVLWAIVTRPDGTAVVVVGGGDAHYTATSATFDPSPATLDDLAAIATDLRLTLS